MRDLTTGMSTALQAQTVRPVLIGRLDIVTDPVRAWTGPGLFLPNATGDTAMDGLTFEPLAPFIDLSPIQEDSGIGGPITITLTGHDLDAELLRQLVRDKRAWRLKKAWLWLGLLNDNQATVIPNPVRIKAGVITNMDVTRGPDSAVVRVTIDTDLGKASGIRTRTISHPVFFPLDTFSAFIVKLSNKPAGLTATDINPSGGPAFRPFNPFRLP